MNKKLLMLGLIPLFFVTMVIAAVVYHSLNVDVTVNEALNFTSISSPSVAGYTGTTITQEIMIYNSADVPIPTRISFVEGSNPSNITYTTNMPFDMGLAHGDNRFNVTYTTSTGSPVGTFNGTIVLTRI